MTDIIDKIFKFEEHDIKVYGTFDNPWFCGKDIATILGYVNSSDAIKDHIDTEDKKTLNDILTGTSE
jgi:anti-repressor protein